jgi:hypothetical protein
MREKMNFDNLTKGTRRSYDKISDNQLRGNGQRPGEFIGHNGKRGWHRQYYLC